MMTLAVTYYAKENLGTNYPMVKFDKDRQLTGGLVTLYKNSTGPTDYILGVRPMEVGETGTSPSVFNGEEWEWVTYECLSCADINDLLSSIRDDCIKMLNSADPSEKAAYDERIFNKYHDASPRDYISTGPLHASEWSTSEQTLIDEYHITPATSDSDLKHITEEMNRDALQCGYELFDTLNYLTEVRDSLRAETVGANR